MREELAWEGAELANCTEGKLSGNDGQLGGVQAPGAAARSRGAVIIDQAGAGAILFRQRNGSRGSPRFRLPTHWGVWRAETLIVEFAPFLCVDPTPPCI